MLRSFLWIGLQHGVVIDGTDAANEILEALGFIYNFSAILLHLGCEYAIIHITSVGARLHERRFL